jgi:hypothetical protein
LNGHGDFFSNARMMRDGFAASKRPIRQPVARPMELAGLNSAD